MSGPPVVIVMLRQPVRSRPNEMRSDPFWEFGSFGCTGCHRANLMHPGRIEELAGVRLAFAQGGAGGFRLVHVTPPVTPHRGTSFCELRWSPQRMPMKYGDAPLLIDNDGCSDFPCLMPMLRTVNRTTWQARFSSRFRSRRKPLPSSIAAALASGYDEHRARAARSAIAAHYHEAMAAPPPCIDQNRLTTYEALSGARPARTRRTICRRC